MALVTQSEFFDYYQQSTATEEKDMTLADLVIVSRVSVAGNLLGPGSWRRTITRSTRALMRLRGRSC